MSLVRLSLPGLCCLAIAAGAAWTRQPDAAPDPAQILMFEVRLSPSEIRVAGDLSSTAHEAILRQLILKRFENHEQQLNFVTRPALPSGWALLTELLMQVMGSTWSGEAYVDAESVRIRAVTTDETAWLDAAARLENHLLAGMDFDFEIAEIRPPGSFDRQCLQLFRTALRGRPVEFARSSAVLSTGAYPLLDELIQIATDCPGTGLGITGHTDSTGDETNNVILSEMRANAVASYLVAGGIAAERIRTAGLGSSRPIVGAGTSRARQINRRIEFEFSFPE